MLDVIKPLLDSDLINEETRQDIQEAWESKLEETRDQVRAELREEFAQRYEHDKSNMVEAIDRMVTEGLTTELQDVKTEKAQLAEDRVKFNASMKENANKFNNFIYIIFNILLNIFIFNIFIMLKCWNHIYCVILD